MTVKRSQVLMAIFGFTLSSMLLQCCLAGEGYGFEPAGIAPSPTVTAEREVVAFVGVQVVPMVRETTLDGMTVVVSKGRIAEMGPAAAISIPENALVIDGKGKFLMPGLVDMHVHTWHEQELTLFVANGVTTVRNMFGSPMHLEWRKEIEQGKRLGPTIYTAGPIVDGKPATWPTSREVVTLEDARAAVLEHAERGFDFIKVYDGITRDVYLELAKAAEKSSLDVVGHIPHQVGLRDVLAAKQRTIEHLFGYETFLESSNSPLRGKTDFFSRLRAWGHMDRDRIPDAVEMVKEAGVWNCATLVVTQKRALSQEELTKELERPYMKYVPPGQIEQWKKMSRSIPGPFAETIRASQVARSELTAALNRAGAGLLLGTDMGNPWVVAGFSAHQELGNLVAAGLTPYEALRAATRAPAECLEATDEFGSVAEGLRADLILLDANPLKDVAHVARLAGVMVRGKWFPATALHQMLEECSTKNEDAKQVQ